MSKLVEQIQALATSFMSQTELADAYFDRHNINGCKGKCQKQRGPLARPIAAAPTMVYIKHI